jgi:O-antigen/teichoic acid export membrane protein
LNRWDDLAANKTVDWVTVIETPSILGDTKEALSASPELAKEGAWKLSAIAGDIATLGTGTLLAGLFNVVLVFFVPRLISVEDYGYWRIFALYAGYAGFLHLGFADGALLRWAGRPIKEFHREIGPALKYLFWQHVFVLVPVCAVAGFVLRGPLRFVVVAVTVFALVFNLSATLQFGLQAAKIFRPVAISSVAAPALFLAFVLLWRSKWQSDYREVITFYSAGWLVVMFFLLTWTKPWGGTKFGGQIGGLARECLLSGWPILMTNMGVMVIMFADRLAVSWAATIQDFAQYSLAASAMAVPLTAIQACNNVFFSHLAGVTPDVRRRIYGITSQTLLMAWAILLPYYFALDYFLRSFLPKYTPSLAYARILLLGIPFLAAIQILQTSYAYLNGVQKQFMMWTGAVLVLSLGITSFTAFHASSLRIVAGVQVAFLGSWWLINEWALRKLTGEAIKGWVKFLAVYALASASYWFATAWNVHGVGISILAYYMGIGVVLVISCQRELRIWGSFKMEKS